MKTNSEIETPHSEEVAQKIREEEDFKNQSDETKIRISDNEVCNGKCNHITDHRPHYNTSC